MEVKRIQGRNNLSSWTSSSWSPFPLGALQPLQPSPSRVS